MTLTNVREKFLVVVDDVMYIAMNFICMVMFAPFFVMADSIGNRKSKVGYVLVTLSILCFYGGLAAIVYYHYN